MTRLYLGALQVLMDPENAAALPQPVMKEKRQSHGRATDPGPASYTASSERRLTRQYSRCRTTVQGEVACSKQDSSQEHPRPWSFRVD